MSKSSFVRNRITLSLFVSIVLMTTVGLLAPRPAAALDLAVQPRLNTGLMYYDFEQEDLFRLVQLGDDIAVIRPFGPSSGISFSDTMPFIGGGATVFFDRFFVDAYVQKAFDGEDEDTQERITIFPSNEFLSNRISREWDRHEYSISAGYAVTDNFALFVGYKRSDTEFDEMNVLTNRGTGEVNTFDSNLDYEQDGPFIGGNYGWRIRETGTLALNLGVAFVDGEIKTTSPGGDTPKITGDTVGLTVGLSWTAPLPILENFNYTVGVDGYNYDFEADEVDATDDAAFQGADFSETVIRATAGVSYAFDFL